MASESQSQQTQSVNRRGRAPSPDGLTKEIQRQLREVDPAIIKQLRDEGYTYPEIAVALQDMKNQEDNLDDAEVDSAYSRAMQNQSQDPRMFASNSMFSPAPNENMIKWQLELDNILERAEHTMRNDKIEFKNGHVIWTSTKDTLERTLNDYGVNEIMKVLSMYLNRNTILSNYDEFTINDIVYDFGCEISDLIFMKYEVMGMDTLEKRKIYPMLVRYLVDIVRNAYMRAMHGGERVSLREARQVQQTEMISPTVNVNQNSAGNNKERSMFNPLRYLRGKYY